MQYAHVIIDHKAGYEPLTYSIPPELLAYVAVGSVVRVPLGPQAVHGVVTKFVSRVDSELASKLKPLKSVVYEGNVIPEYLLQAVLDLHARYNFSVSDCLFAFLPNLPIKRQQAITPLITQTEGYKFTELNLPISSRPEAYMQLAHKLFEQTLSLLVICHSQASVQALAHTLKRNKVPLVLCPQSHQQKTRRDYFLAGLTTPSPTVFIGTRGALVTPLNSIGAVIIDEPWLPGHKEENAPKLWSIMAAKFLCKARNIPLYSASLYSWPETELIDHTQHYAPEFTPGTINLAPRRNLQETISNFLSEYDEPKKELAIVIKESLHDVWWCSACKTVVSVAENCPTCGSTTLQLPKLTKESVVQEIPPDLASTVTVYSFDSLERFKTFDACLLLNFDNLLAINDFRSSLYLATLIGIARTQAHHTTLVTNHPDTWVDIIHKSPAELTAKEKNERREHLLPPFSTAVHLVSPDKGPLEKNLTGLARFCYQNWPHSHGQATLFSFAITKTHRANSRVLAQNRPCGYFAQLRGIKNGANRSSPQSLSPCSSTVAAAPVRIAPCHRIDSDLHLARVPVRERRRRREHSGCFVSVRLSDQPDTTRASGPRSRR